MHGSNRERTGPCHHDDGTARKRMATSARSRWPLSRDNIVQRATAALLNAIYEEEFLGSRTGSGLGAASMTRWTRLWSGSAAER
jgi:hypothetical protein